MELKDRELAIRWWKRRTLPEQVILLEESGLHRRTEKLTDREIEYIWINQPHNCI